MAILYAHTYSVGVAREERRAWYPLLTHVLNYDIRLMLTIYSRFNNDVFIQRMYANVYLGKAITSWKYRNKQR